MLAGAIALPFSVRARRWQPVSDRAIRGLVALAGVGLGIALWSIEGVVHGDALFHLGRMRKLDDFGSLSLRAVDEFKDGGLHPGYAFPLWHGWLALVAKLAGVDPTSVVLHESSILAPLALVLAFEMGRAVFRSTWLAVGTVLVQVSLIALAPGGGGSYTTLELPGTVARQLLVPAVIALFFRLRARHPRGRSVRRSPRQRSTSRSCTRRTRSSSRSRSSALRSHAPLIAGVDMRRSAVGLVVVRRSRVARLRVAPADRARDAVAHSRPRRSSRRA